MNKRENDIHVVKLPEYVVRERSIGHFPISVGDWWYAKRIESDIGQGRIHIVEDSEEKYARMICMRKKCDFMTELKEMKNIGTEIKKKLKSVGIETAEELIQLGGKEAFVRLKMRYSNVCLVHLYTLQGAIDNMEYNQLPEDVKQDLKSFSDGFK